LPDVDPVLRLSLAEFSLEAEGFDRAALETPGIDPICSSTLWILPAHAAFHPDNTPYVFRGEAGYLALSQGHAEAIGRYLAPLEATWCLACPLIGARSEAIVAESLACLVELEPSWDALWLSGLPVRSGLFRGLAESLGQRYRLGLGPTSGRRVASLAGGYEGFLGRRSAGFRANLRRSLRTAAEAGIRFEWLGRGVGPSEVVPLFERFMAIEARSWKGMAEVGVNQGAMRTFYEAMLPLLSARAAFRAVVAVKDGRDLGYLFGGVVGTRYRGFQASFDESQRARGLGNALQATMIQHLGEEGVRVYDLGQEMPYKARWGEDLVETVALVARR
jgi:hypothetical protein